MFILNAYKTRPIAKSRVWLSKKKIKTSEKLTSILKTKMNVKQEKKLDQPTVRPTDQPSRLTNDSEFEELKKRLNE